MLEIDKETKTCIRLYLFAQYQYQHNNSKSMCWSLTVIFRWGYKVFRNTQGHKLLPPDFESFPMRGPDPGPGGVVVLLTLRENQVLVQGLISPASNYEGTVKQAVNNRTFPCMEATNLYAIKNQLKAPKAPY